MKYTKEILANYQMLFAFNAILFQVKNFRGIGIQEKIFYIR